MAGMGQWQLQKLAQQSPLDLAERSDKPAHLEFIQVRHAPQERGPASPARRHAGWRVGVGGGLGVLPKSGLRFRGPAVKAGRPELGRSNVGRLLLGYGSQVRAHAGTDCFDIHSDRRLKRCAGLFDSKARATDPVALLRRLHHKSRYRDGRARALLARLSADLSVWLGWDVGGSLGGEGALEARWQATRRSLRRPMIVAVDVARHVFDASIHLDDPDPLQQTGVILLYSLYPELEDRALGFLTRGCPQRCPFCVVPVKEGTPRQVSDLETLLQGRQKLSLLDDNLLAHPSALELLQEIARRDLAVNFNQTLDVRRLTAESAWLLRRIRCSNPAFTRRNYYFSLNDARHLELVRERYALLQTNGRDNSEFVCMYGFNTSLAEDVKRFRFLRSLPGAYVFMQRYRPVPGGPEPNLSRLFDEGAEALLDEIVRIVFRQNMKSMETYYRWLARQYAEQCGRIHHRLVETLFRYNSRPRMGGFLHRLEQMVKDYRVLASQTTQSRPEAAVDHLESTG